MIVPDPPLARTLYANVEIGRQIPEDLFHAVAQLLAYVYRVAGAPEGRSMNNVLSQGRQARRPRRRRRHRPDRGDADHPAAAAAAGLLHHAEHLGGADDRRGHDVRAARAGLLVVPDDPAAHHALPPGDQRVRDASDPARGRRGPRGRGVRQLRRRRQHRRRPRDLPDPDRDPVRGHHERRRARGRGRRALHPRRHAGQADGDRRRPQHRPDHRRGGAQAPRRGRPGGGLLRRDGRCLEVRQGRRDGRHPDHRHQPARRHHHRRRPAGHAVRRGRPATSRCCRSATASAPRSRRC